MRTLSAAALALLLAGSAAAQVVYVPFRAIQKETRGMPIPPAGPMKTGLTGPSNDVLIRGSNLRRAHGEILLDPFILLSMTAPAATLSDAQEARLFRGLARLDAGEKGPLAVEHWDALVSFLLPELQAATKRLATESPTNASLDPIIDRLLARAAQLAQGIRDVAELRND